VSDAVAKAIDHIKDGRSAFSAGAIGAFVIRKPKPDPLAGVLEEVFSVSAVSGRINAALDALGFEIRKKGQ
jgi:hypothetical protein